MSAGVKKKSVFGFTAFLFLFCQSGIFAENNKPYAVDILQKAIHITSPQYFKAEIEMEYLRADGTHSKYKMILRNKKYTRSHISFQEPDREKGRQVLRIEENLWTYMPKTKKIVQISFDSEFMGGDFANQDIVRLNLLEDYNAEIAKETDTQYILDLTPKGKGFSYNKVRYWVRKKDNMPLQIFYFSRTGNALKKMVYKDLKDFNGFVRPTVYEMTNLAENTKTVLTFVSFQKLNSLPDTFFYKENLGK